MVPGWPRQRDHVQRRRAVRALRRRWIVASERALRRWERVPTVYRQGTSIAVAVLALVLVGLMAWSCAPRLAPPPQPVYTPVTYDALPGWAEDRLAEVRPALAQSCERFAALPADRSMAANPRDALRPIVGRVAAWRHVCRRLERVPPGHDPSFRAFIERTFQPYAVTSTDTDAPGLFTGYYEADIRAARTRHGPYQVPVHGVPDDLVTVEGQGRSSDGTPYPDRAAIEAGALDGKAPVLFWADDAVDLHILHIQGSGRVTLPDGSTTRIGYAANNGQPFVGIGGVLRDRGLADGASMPAIRAWLKANPEQAGALMRQNPRYIFFREITGDGPIGAFSVPLTPLRSLAVDPTVIPLGALVWLDTRGPDGAPLQRLVAAQDTGAAIKGLNRGDVYWGSGEAAFDQAGRMARPGRLFLLLPRSFGLDPVIL